MEQLPLGKSAGPDRLPNAFYKTMSAIVAPRLTAVLNEARANQELPESLRQGLISVLYKKRDRTDPRNYRPITLLNGDYKIFTRALTKRMNAAVLEFVSDPQNGFVPHGFIAENTVLLKLLQAHLEEPDEDGKKAEALMVFLDMEKAFDKVSFDYVREALPALGFTSGCTDFTDLQLIS